MNKSVILPGDRGRGPGRALGIPNHDPKPVSEEDHNMIKLIVTAYSPISTVADRPGT